MTNLLLQIYYTIITMIIIITTISIFALSLLQPSWKLPQIIIIITTTIIINQFNYRLADTVQLLTSWMFTDAARWKPLPTSPTSSTSSMLLSAMSSSLLRLIFTLWHHDIVFQVTSGGITELLARCPNISHLNLAGSLL